MNKPERLLTFDEFLDFEAASEERHEFLDGRIYSVSQRHPASDTVESSRRHDHIRSNLALVLGNELSGTVSVTLDLTAASCLIKQLK